ncbi:hypothetical protein HNI00_08095 [Thermoleptolyngbya oregonensis NK1-22]|uniref:Uncharacterized protein n=1 Tax=Thermoleptolyngbya oregonensis NK1-22 TaxID=2547457 RepID=A0AA97BCU0_9CYAN|nr:hypothetical protein [Thermoleptolyngbya oregonensis]WOB43121.1 hypothetical protein HNI00_08095 [Thermoleptolyngbya oregonensis NK1-22]
MLGEPGKFFISRFYTCGRDDRDQGDRGQGDRSQGDRPYSASPCTFGRSP